MDLTQSLYTMDSFMKESERTCVLELTKELLFYEFNIDLPLTLYLYVHCALSNRLLRFFHLRN